MVSSADTFDAWFTRTNGDPWNCECPYVQDRLDASLAFVRKSVGQNFNGTFLEFGAFRGHFTERLAVSFPEAFVAASDVSRVAVTACRQRTAGFNNVTVQQADIATYTIPCETKAPYKILLLECLYYLPHKERLPALRRLAETTARADIFISCPITGGSYPTHRDLCASLSEIGYELITYRTLNRKSFFLPNQTIYFFEAPEISRDS